MLLMYTLTAPAVYAARLHGGLICAALGVVSVVVDKYRQDATHSEPQEMSR